MGILLGVLNYRQIADRFIVMQFTPTQQVRQIVADTHLTELGERILLANRPEINEAKTFNTHCAEEEKTNAVLGCYDGENIYLFAIKNDELKGIVEVTAAHEMLHAAYDRLHFWEFNDVRHLIEKEYDRLKADKNFVERMKVYSDLPYEDQVNELHSVIGTEVDTLSPELEEYYKRYFVDRKKIVKLHDNYADTFERLEKESAALSEKINKDVEKINTIVVQYNADVDALSAAIDNFNARADAGSFTSRQQFSAERNQLVYRSQTLDNTYTAIQKMIADNDADRKKYNEISLHINELNASINSKTVKAPSIQ